MKIRMIDYILFYVLGAIYGILNLSVPFSAWNIISCFIMAFIPSLILGTITNLLRILFKKKV